MLKKIFFNQTFRLRFPHYRSGSATRQAGFTVIELMVVLVITAVITVTSIVYINKDDIRGDLDIAGNNLMSDIRYARNLAATRAKHDFGGTIGNVYPDNGYGILISLPHGGYWIFADKELPGLEDPNTEFVGGIAGMISISSEMSLLDLNVASPENYTYFTFKSENELSTNLIVSSSGKYQIELDYTPAEHTEDGYKNTITIGEALEDGSIWVALGRNSEGYDIPAPIVCTANNALGCAIPGGFCCGAAAGYSCNADRCTCPSCDFREDT